MSRRVFLTVVAVALIVLAGCASPDNDGRQPQATRLSFIEDVPAPEDLVAVPGSAWVVTSTMAHGRGNPGGLGVVDSESGRYERLWPRVGAGSEWDRQAYPDCDGPPDRAAASPHGVNIVAAGPDRFMLYAVNHGGREAVEAFTIDTSAGRPAATWTGCVLLPDDVSANGVVGLPDGGIAVTNFHDPAVADPVAATFANKPSGDVRVWRAGAGWSTIPGSELRGPNGIELSPDGKAFYVSVWPDRSIVSVPLSGGSAPLADVPFLPDNLRWTASGTLLVTGQDFPDAGSITACARAGKDCPPGFRVVEVDPDSRKTHSLFDTDTTEFGFPTVAAPVGDEVWIGTIAHDKIARVTGLLSPST